MSQQDVPGLKLGRFHTKRLREVYRSAGWPFLDTVEIELIAAGLLRRVTEATGHETVRVTATGIAYLAQSIQRNRQNRSAHEMLVDRIGQEMLSEGRVVWTGLGSTCGFAVRSWRARTLEDVPAGCVFYSQHVCRQLSGANRSRNQSQ